MNLFLKQSQNIFIFSAHTDEAFDLFYVSMGPCYKDYHPRRIRTLLLDPEAQRTAIKISLFL